MIINNDLKRNLKKNFYILICREKKCVFFIFSNEVVIFRNTRDQGMALNLGRQVGL